MNAILAPVGDLVSYGIGTSTKIAASWEVQVKVESEASLLDDNDDTLDEDDGFGGEYSENIGTPDLAPDSDSNHDLNASSRSSSRTGIAFVIDFRF